MFFFVFYYVLCCFVCFFFSSRSRHTRCALVTGVQTCALPIYRDADWLRAADHRPRSRDRARVLLHGPLQPPSGRGAGSRRPAGGRAGEGAALQPAHRDAARRSPAAAPPPAHDLARLSDGPAPPAPGHTLHRRRPLRVPPPPPHLRRTPSPPAPTPP